MDNFMQSTVLFTPSLELVSLLIGINAGRGTVSKQVFKPELLWVNFPPPPPPKKKKNYIVFEVKWK